MSYLNWPVADALVRAVADAGPGVLGPVEALPAYCACCGCVTRYRNCSCCCAKKAVTAVDSEQEALDIATEAMAQLREYPRGSAEHDEALTVMHAAMAEHARLASARILAEWSAREGSPR